MSAVAEWSEKDTRCAVCLRLFPSPADIERHADKECDPDPCWCWDLCWVEWGSWCDPPADLSDTLALFLALRGAQEEIERLRALVPGMAGEVPVCAPAASENHNRVVPAQDQHSATEHPNGRSE